MLPPGARPFQSKQAFTLAEVLFASVVLLIAIVGLFEAVTIGAGMLNVARRQSVALQIIRTEIEAVHLNTTWTASSPLDGTTPQVDVDTVTSATYPELMSLKNVGRGFKLSRTIVTIRPPPAGPNWLRKVTFTVTWTESTGRTFSRTGYTYCANNGFNALYQR